MGSTRFESSISFLCPTLVTTIFFFIHVLFSIVDVDECKSSETNECGLNALCNNTEGSYICSCVSGYQGDGRNCKGEYYSRRLEWGFDCVIYCTIAPGRVSDIFSCLAKTTVLEQDTRTLKPPAADTYNDNEQLELPAMYCSIPISESANTRDSILELKKL